MAPTKPLGPKWANYSVRSVVLAGAASPLHVLVSWCPDEDDFGRRFLTLDDVLVWFGGEWQPLGVVFGNCYERLADAIEAALAEQAERERVLEAEQFDEPERV